MTMTISAQPAKRCARAFRRSLLAATALVAAAAGPAWAGYRFSTTGTYSGTIIINSAEREFSLSVVSGAVGTFVGILHIEGGMFVPRLNIGSTGDGANNGTIIFAPSAIDRVGGSYVNIFLDAGTAQIGSQAGRDLLAHERTQVALRSGTLDLAGQDLAIRSLFTGVDGNEGTVRNNTAGTTAVLALVGANINSANRIVDGLGKIRLRKEGNRLLSVVGSQSYSGGTEFAAGAIQFDKGSPTQSDISIGTGEILLNAETGNTLQLRAMSQGLALTNDLRFENGSVVDIPVFHEGSVTLKGARSGRGEIRKTSIGTLVLQGDGSQSALRYEVYDGTLRTEGNGDAIGANSNVAVWTDATLHVAQSDRLSVLSGMGTVQLDAGKQLDIAGVDKESRFEGQVVGAGSLRKSGSGELILTKANSYSGGTVFNNGAIRATADGALGTGKITVEDDNTELILGETGGVTLNNEIAFNIPGNQGASVRVDEGNISTLSGTLRDLSSPGKNDVMFHKTGLGRLTLTGTTEGNVRHQAGRLQVAVTATSVGVMRDAVLGGNGTIDDLWISGGGILEGTSGQQLTAGKLFADGEGGPALINVRLGQPGGPALFKVLGDLTLSATFNVSDAGGFGQGVYRLIDYGGTFTNNGIGIGTTPDGYKKEDLVLQTSIAKQINLVVGGAGPDKNILFWDGADSEGNGAIDGGSGTWAAQQPNWTSADGSANTAWGGRFAVFQGTAGTVNVVADGEPIKITGMQFASDGYRVEGGNLALNQAETNIRVGDGSAAGSQMTATIASGLTGTGAIVKDDLGTLVLTGANTYLGNTIVRAGTLVGNAGSIRNAIANAGKVVFDQGDDATFAGAIGGTGTMVKNGAGKLTLTGASGLDWTVDRGTLASATDRFGGDVEIGAEGMMRFDQAASGAYAGIVSGEGALRLNTGSGNTVRLTGDSSAFDGFTTVESGALDIAGKLGGELLMRDGTLLGGTGMVGSTTIASGATIAPGNSIGTLAVAGDFLQEAGSVYHAEIDAGGSSDRIAVGGRATLQGGTVRVTKLAGSYNRTIRYTILSAVGGVTGKYAVLDQDRPFLNMALGYGANDVYLDMVRNSTAFCDAAQTRNQCSAARGAESLGAGNSVYNAIAAVSDQAMARQAFDALSGEAHASTRSALVDDSRFLREAANRRVREAFAEPGETLGGVWLQGFGSWGSTQTTVETAALHRSIGGLFVGADGEIGDNWRAGVVAGYSSSTLKADARASSASVKSYTLGAYAGAEWGAWTLRGGLAHAWHDVEAARSVAFDGFKDSLKSDYDARTTQFYSEVGYAMHAGGMRFEPFAGLAIVHVASEGFREKGGAAALDGRAGSDTVPFTTFGMHAETQLIVGTEAVLKARGMLGWRHAFGDVTPDAGLRFVSGGSAFAISGAPIARDSLVLETGLDLAIGAATTLGISYTGNLGGDASDHSMKGNLSIRF